MMKMNQPKLEPTMAQMKIQKDLYFLCFSNTFAYLAALVSLHMASALSAPLAKMCKKPLVLLFFGDFDNSVLKLHEETGKNDENEPVQVGANNGPNENAKKHIFPVLFLHLCTHLGTCGPSGNTHPLQA